MNERQRLTDLRSKATCKRAKQKVDKSVDEIKEIVNRLAELRQEIQKFGEG